MAVLVTARIPASGPDEAEVWHERNKSLPQQPGFIFQADGPASGGWQVISAWESRDDFQRYFDTVVRPSLPDGAEPPGGMTVEELASVVKA